MTQLSPFLITIILLTSCEKQRKQIEEFVVNQKQISSKTIHEYEFYPDGKIKTDHSRILYIRAGRTLDTLSSKKEFKYHANGKVESIFDASDSAKTFKTYNDMDSLITDIRINGFGDTTFFEKIDYQNGNETRRISRLLMTKFSANAEDIKKTDFRNYDTLLDITQFMYVGKLREKALSIDKNGNITAEIHYIYNQGKHIKTIVYSFLGSTKYIRETTDYTDGETKEPDYVTVGPRGDTIAFQKTTSENDMRITVICNNLNSRDIWYYNKKNQLVGTVSIDYLSHMKYFNAYTYDDKGNILEEQNYKESLNNTH
ncbi:MAG TPA: hypothetical protein VL728_16370 [Cyclobacteriaceae bacterium]|jgi:hypothetical protein|nr:hypothetical protein [Cyclobacteriaceae bacterium]